MEKVKGFLISTKVKLLNAMDSLNKKAKKFVKHEGKCEIQHSTNQNNHSIVVDIEEKVKILQNGGFNNGIDYINGEMIFSKILKEKRKKKNLIKKNNDESMLCASGNMIDIENGQYLKSYKNEGKINNINKEYLNETDNDKQMKIKKEFNKFNIINEHNKSKTNIHNNKSIDEKSKSIENVNVNNKNVTNENKTIINSSRKRKGDTIYSIPEKTLDLRWETDITTEEKERIHNIQINIINEYNKSKTNIRNNKSIDEESKSIENVNNINVTNENKIISNYSRKRKGDTIYSIPEKTLDLRWETDITTEEKERIHNIQINIINEYNKSKTNIRNNKSIDEESKSIENVNNINVTNENKTISNSSRKRKGDTINSIPEKKLDIKMDTDITTEEKERINNIQINRNIDFVCINIETNCNTENRKYMIYNNIETRNSKRSLQEEYLFSSQEKKRKLNTENIKENTNIIKIAESYSISNIKENELLVDELKQSDNIKITKDDYESDNELSDFTDDTDDFKLYISLENNCIPDDKNCARAENDEYVELDDEAEKEWLREIMNMKEVEQPRSNVKEYANRYINTLVDMEEHVRAFLTIRFLNQTIHAANETMKLERICKCNNDIKLN